MRSLTPREPGLKTATFNGQSRPSLARGVRLQIDAKTGEQVLLFPEGVLCLSASAQEIVVRCDGRLTAEEIVSSLACEFEVDEATLRNDVFECLLQLCERKLLAF